MPFSVLKKQLHQDARRPPKRPRNLPRFRPSVQVLEDRILPATIRWTGGLTSDWHGPLTNWTVGGTGEHRLPISSDDVIIDLNGATVSHSSIDSDTVNSLTTSNGTFNLSSGTLAVTHALQGSSAFNLSGNGVLANATASLTIHALGGTLSGVTVTVNSNLDISHGAVTVINGLMLNG